MHLASIKTTKGRDQRANILQIVTLLLVLFDIGSRWLWFSCYGTVLLTIGVNRVLVARDNRRVKAAATSLEDAQ